LAEAVEPGAHPEHGDLTGPFELLAEMTQVFADSRDIERTLERALVTIGEQLGAEAGSLWLIEEDGETLECHASVGPETITGARLPMSQGIVGRSVRRNLCQRVLDVTTDPEFSPAIDEQSGFETRSLLCAPMSVKDRPLGAIELVNKRGGDGKFAPGDLHLLHALASSAALAIANARMAASLAEHERVRRELELAAEIQRSLLPPPRPAPFPLFGVNVPARSVSGDFFDILPLPDGRIAFCLGDVSGKGINAALMMAKTASLYRCLAKTAESPGRLLGVLNEELCETSTRGMFVTMVAGTFDPRRGVACVANAGHEPPLCRSGSGEVTFIPAEAPPLGITTELGPQGAVPGEEVEFSEGSLYVFSDGLTEACSGDGPVGAEGLARLIARFADRPLDSRVRAIVEEVSRLELRDDLTLLGVSAERARR
jgi:sigma-B regulation protein RsbU (phosphoserine phosphatase)